MYSTATLQHVCEPHQRTQEEAEKGDADCTPDRRAAEVAAVRGALLALVKQPPHREAQRRAHRQ